MAMLAVHEINKRAKVPLDVTPIDSSYACKRLSFDKVTEVRSGPNARVVTIQFEAHTFVGTGRTQRRRVELFEATWDSVLGVDDSSATAGEGTRSKGKAGTLGTAGGGGGGSATLSDCDVPTGNDMANDKCDALETKKTGRCTQWIIGMRYDSDTESFDGLPGVMVTGQEMFLRLEFKTRDGDKKQEEPARASFRDETSGVEFDQSIFSVGFGTTGYWRSWSLANDAPIGFHPVTVTATTYNASTHVAILPSRAQLEADPGIWGDAQRTLGKVRRVVDINRISRYHGDEACVPSGVGAPFCVCALSGGGGEAKAGGEAGSGS